MNKNERTYSSGEPHSALAWGAQPRSAFFQLTLLVLTLCVATSPAADRRSATIDSGGRRITSANYTIHSSIGGIGGMSSVVVPSEVARHGYIGQLFEVTNVVVTATPATVNEGATSQLDGFASFDDGTVGIIPGASVGWTQPAYPLSSISVLGVATATNVFVTTNTVVAGYCYSMTGTGTVQVVDSDPDNWGIYAGDVVPDWWQVQYFGLNDYNGLASVDPDSDGGNNLFEYTTGTVPTEWASAFALRIEAVAGQPGQKKLVFSPRWNDRTYIPQFTTDLTAGTYGTLTGTSTSDVGSERTVTDLNASESSKSYRIKITYP